MSMVPGMTGATKHIGMKRKRTEDPLILMGKAKYVDDIELPGMLEIAFLRSTHAHADIVRVDLEKARNHPGCIKIYTSADLGGHTTTFQENQAKLIPVSHAIFRRRKGSVCR